MICNKCGNDNWSTWTSSSSFKVYKYWNVGLAFELRGCGEKALRTGRERGSFALTWPFLLVRFICG